VPTALRLLTIPATAAVLLTGVWVTGALLTNDFLLAMVLTTAWMGAAGFAALVVAVRSRALRWPALKGNCGNQQYRLSPDLDLGRHSTAVVWCRAFSVLFARAPLRVADAAVA
jgi:hypothetical protein